VLWQNPITSFFNRGIVEQNQVAFQQGDAKNSFYFSAQNVIDKGVVPKDKNTRTSVSVRGARTFGMFQSRLLCELTPVPASVLTLQVTTVHCFTPLFCNGLRFWISNNSRIQTTVLL
jgi:hypothetical protein